MPAHPGARGTARLRLEPVGPEHARDLWRLHQDEAVAAWHGGPWSMRDARRYAAAMAGLWAADGVGKWVAYDRRGGELVGRGGLSRLAATSAVSGQVAALLAGQAWLADRLELGWTVRSELWGQGYATEIGWAGLDLAFGELGAGRVVAFTERHNRRSRAVMERLGMGYVGELTAPGLVEGRAGVHEDAPFALYASAPAAEAPGGQGRWSCQSLRMRSSSPR